MILKCQCQHEGQDFLHGEGRRVFNMCKPSSPQVYKCTVCCRTITKGAGKDDKKHNKTK